MVVDDLPPPDSGVDPNWTLWTTLDPVVDFRVGTRREGDPPRPAVPKGLDWVVRPGTCRHHTSEVERRPDSKTRRTDPRRVLVVLGDASSIVKSCFLVDFGGELLRPDSSSGATKGRVSHRPDTKAGRPSGPRVDPVRKGVPGGRGRPGGGRLTGVLSGEGTHVSAGPPV